MHEIGTWFLLVSLVLPRFTLLFWWLFGNLPYNETPFAVDFFTAIFLPRILIMVYIYDLMGFSPWFWIHMVGLAISVRIGLSGVYSPSKRD